MSLAYYNENDPKAAAWLRELIKRGHIAPGHVDERSITEVSPSDLTPYAQCHFFAGIGGWSLALRLAGVPDSRPVWTGSCPCQPFSAAGKHLGDKDDRHLWPVFFRLIAQRRPVLVFGEQVANAIGKGWLDGISADLEREDYACGAVVLGAHSVGAPHIRQRLYWMANAGHSPVRRSSRSIEAQGGRAFSPAAGRRADGGLADSANDGRAEHEHESRGRRETRQGDAAECAGTCGMEHATSDGREQRRAESDGRGIACGRESRGMGDASSEGSGRNSGAVSRAEGKGERGREKLGSFADESLDAGANRWMGEPIQQGLERHAGDGDHGNQSGRIGAESDGSTTAPSRPWDSFDLLPCTDGKARRIPVPESAILWMADGFFYSMAHVRAELCTQAIIEIESYAETRRSNPEEIVFMVQEDARTEAFQRALGGQGGVYQTEVLLAFMRDVSSALDGASDGRSSQEEGAQEDGRVLRDLRNVVAAECASHRRESEEQHGCKPSDSLPALSQFLARCGKTGGYLPSREDAATFPLVRKVKGRVGLLRGYGNAIVPEVAAEFIQAGLEAIQ